MSYIAKITVEIFSPEGVSLVTESKDVPLQFEDSGHAIEECSTVVAAAVHSIENCFE